MSLIHIEKTDEKFHVHIEGSIVDFSTMLTFMAHEQGTDEILRSINKASRLALGAYKELFADEKAEN